MPSTTKHVLKIGGMMAIVVIIFVVIVAVMTYIFNDDSVLSQSIRRIVPMPAATVNTTHWISSAAVDDNMRALQKQLNNPEVAESGLRVDFSTPDGQKRLMLSKKDVLNKMIEDEVIIILSKERGLIVDEKSLYSDLDDLFADADREMSAQEQVKEDYGWNISTFMERIVIPNNQRELLEEWYYANISPEPTRKQQISAAKKELDDQRNFSSVAQNYSEGPSAGSGGQIGWWESELLMDELAAVAFDMEQGDTSDIIETPIGYHIIFVNQIRERNDSEPKAINLSQIFVAKKTFGEWLEEQMRKMTFSVPAAEFTWNSERQVVDFTDQDMQTFEEEALSNPQSDASLF